MNNDDKMYEFLGESEHDFIPSPKEWADAQSLMDEYLQKRKQRRYFIWLLFLFFGLASATWLGYSSWKNERNIATELGKPMAKNQSAKNELKVDKQILIEKNLSNHQVTNDELIKNNYADLKQDDTRENQISSVLSENTKIKKSATNTPNVLLNSSATDLNKTTVKILDSKLTNLLKKDTINTVGNSNEAGLNALFTLSSFIIDNDEHYIEITEQVASLDERNKIFLKQLETRTHHLSYRPFLELASQGFIKSDATETSRYGWSSLLGLEFVLNNFWYLSAGTGVSANYGQWGLTNDVYYDQSNFGVEFERWRITPKAVYNWTSKVGMGVKLGKQEMALFIKSHYSIGSYSDVLYNRFSALEIKKANGSNTNVPKTKKYWVKESGLKNPRWDVGINYGRELGSNIALSSSLIWRLQNTKQLDGSILKLPDDISSHVFPRFGFELGLKYTFN